MNGNELMNHMIKMYEPSYDIERPYNIDEDRYDAYGALTVNSSKYVLMKKAELWRADCYEHVFFKSVETITSDNISLFRHEIESFIEPELIRHGEKMTKPDHMYSYITGIFFSEHRPDPEVIRMIKRFRFMKNYLFGFRGYSEARIVVFDMEEAKLYGNPAARELTKEYKKLI